MKKKDMFNIVRDLPFDVKKTVFEEDSLKVQLYRPSRLSKRFQSYDKNRNFQIWLQESEREFRPNHMRVMIDLNLRVRGRPDLKKQLLLAFDNIFYGHDPETELEKLSHENFEHFLNNIKTIGVLAQLFVIEQEYCYNKESKFDPPTLFFQGWIREFIDNPKEIDNLCMSVCNGQPALSKYTAKENRKSKKYSKDLSPLWYLEQCHQSKL